MLARSTSRFLVALRSAHCHHPGTYATIGGAVDSGESPAEAMKREVMEECGYSGPIIEAKALYVFSQETKAGTTFTYHNFLVVIEDEFEPHLHWETEQFLWVNNEELSQLNPKHFGLEALLVNSGSVLNSYSAQV